jgi:hypothetical protein
MSLHATFASREISSVRVSWPLRSACLDRLAGLNEAASKSRALSVENYESSVIGLVI